MSNRHRILSKGQVALLLAIVLCVPLGVTLTRMVDFRANDSVQLGCEPYIADLQLQDERDGIANSGVLFLGGERLQRWRSPPGQLAGRDVMMRGSKYFGPAQVADCFTRAVGFYRPSITFLFFDLADLDRPEAELLEALSEIDKQRRYFEISPVLGLVLPLPTPAMSREPETLEAFERTLTRWTEAHSGVYIFDASNSVSSLGKSVDPTLFWPDGSTLTKAGYASFEAKLAEEISRFAPKKSG